MLSRAEVVALASETGLEAWSDRLADTVTPGWRLEPDQASDAETTGVTKIGGGADLADGERWPTNRRGIPMTLLGQVNAADLPAFDVAWREGNPWRHGGELVRIFADLVESPNEPCKAVVLSCAPGRPVRRVAPPQVPDPWPTGGPQDWADAEERVGSLAELPVRAVAFLSAPEVHPELRPTLYGHDADTAERYAEWWRRLRIDGRQRDDEGRAGHDVHTLLGEPSSVQNDVRGQGAMMHRERSWAEQVDVEQEPALANVDAWRVLFHIAYDGRHGLYIQDDGAFTVLAPIDDLAHGRYDRAICAVASG